ncbi:MAG: uridine kinase [Gemmatimonadaceae bacterium]
MKSLVVGIAGGSGSGKSTVARKLIEALRETSVVCIDMDAYYRDLRHLDLDERRTTNWDHPDSFDLDLLATQLQRLASGETIDKPVYDFVQHLRGGRADRLRPAHVIVVEGILLFVDPRIRDLCDIKVFVDADADTRLIRRIRRDMRVRGRALDEILDQYLTSVQPMHLQFVEPSKRYADVILPGGGHNAVGIEMITARVYRSLQEPGNP